MSRIHLFNILRLTLLIPIAGTALEFSEASQLLNNYGEKILGGHTVSMRLMQETPFSLNETNGSRISSKKMDYELQYNHSIPGARNLGITWFQTQDAFSFEDTSDTYAKVNNAGSQGVKFDLNQKFGGNDLELGLRITNSLGLEEIQIGYDYHWKNLSFHLGLESGQRSWNVDLGNSDNDFYARIDQFQTLGELGTTFNSKHGNFSVHFKTSIPIIYPEISLEGLYLPLRPCRSSLEFNYHYPISEYSSFALGFSTSTDTVNAELENMDDIIGKIYALDQKEQKLRLGLVSKHFGLTLAYRDLQGDLSAYFLASPFGSLLSQLSGARYYQILKADLSFLSFSFSANNQFGERLTIGFENSIYLGKGTYYERHYVFQLFNPIGDLSIQEINVNRFVVNDIGFHIRSIIHSNFTLMLKGTYLLPLYIDIDANPIREFNSGDLTLGSSIELGLHYHY